MTILKNITGERPAEIINHVKAEEYIILGISPDEFMQRHRGDIFDIQGLVDAFKLICKDYERVRNADRVDGSRFLLQSDLLRGTTEQICETKHL